MDAEAGGGRISERQKRRKVCVFGVGRYLVVAWGLCNVSLATGFLL